MEYIKISNKEDDYLKLIPDNPDNYNLVLATTIEILPHDSFIYSGNIKINTLQPHVGIYFAPEYLNNPPFICHVPEITWRHPTIILQIYNPSNVSLTLLPDTILGSFWIAIPAKLTEKPQPTPYYKSDGIEVIQLKPNAIEKFSYTITPEGKKTLEFELNDKEY